MKKLILATLVCSAASIFAAAEASSKAPAAGGAEARIAAAQKKIEALNASIAQENQRIANRNEIDGMIKGAEGMPVTNPAQGDAACKAFNAAGDKLQQVSKSGLKRPVDGHGAQFNARIKKGKQAVIKSSKGLTCKQLDFIVDDAPVATAQ